MQVLRRQQPPGRHVVGGPGRRGAANQNGRERDAAELHVVGLEGSRARGGAKGRRNQPMCKRRPAQQGTLDNVVLCGREPHAKVTFDYPLASKVEVMNEDRDASLKVGQFDDVSSSLL